MKVCIMRKNKLKQSHNGGGFNGRKQLLDVTQNLLCVFHGGCRRPITLLSRSTKYYRIYIWDNVTGVPEPNAIEPGSSRAAK